MKNRLLLSLLVAAGTLASTADAESNRGPLSAPPRILGREIERFVMTDYITLAGPSGIFARGMFVIPAGQFVPVSEDAGGVYFQATNAFQARGGYSGSMDGGLYVSKTTAGEVTAYFGNARAGQNVNLSNRPLSRDDVKKLKIGKAERVEKAEKPRTKKK